MARMAGERALNLASTSHSHREASPRALDDVWGAELSQSDMNRERGFNSDDDDYIAPGAQHPGRTMFSSSGRTDISPVRVVIALVEGLRKYVASFRLSPITSLPRDQVGTPPLSPLH